MNYFQNLKSLGNKIQFKKMNNLLNNLNINQLHLHLIHNKK